MRALTLNELKQPKTVIYIIFVIIISIILIAYSMLNQTSEEQINIDIPIGNNVVLIETPVIEEKEEEEKPIVDIDKVHAEMLARLAWGEARGCTKTEQAAVMWCVLNRVDSDSPHFRDTIAKVITQPNQFYYSATFPLKEDLLELAYDILTRWYMEKETGEIDSGRVLPKEYCFFGGDGKRNWFRDAYEFKDANIWDWSLDSPYEE